MAQSLSNYDNVLKEHYETLISDTIVNGVVAFKTLDDSDRQWAGRRVVHAVHSARSSGVGNRSESGTLPTASNQSYQQSIITSTYMYGVGSITGQVIEAGKNAFIGALSSELELLTKDVINDASRQCHGFGNGIVAQVATSATASPETKITLYNRFYKPGHPGARYLQANSSVIDGGTIASPTADFSDVTVTNVSISESPGTTTDAIEASAGGMSGVSAGNFIFNRGAGGEGVEMKGLAGLIDNYSSTNIFGSVGFLSATVQGIDRSSFANWNSIVLANSSTERIVDSQLLQKSFDRISVESGLEPDLIWGHHDTVRAVLESVTGDRRYMTPEFKLGSSNLTFNGIPIVKDRHAAFNSLYVLNRKALKMYTLSDFKFADQDGSVLSRSSNSDVFNFYIRAYKQLGIEIPKACCVIRDIKVDFA